MRMFQLMFIVLFTGVNCAMFLKQPECGAAAKLRREKKPDKYYTSRINLEEPSFLTEILGYLTYTSSVDPKAIIESFQQKTIPSFGFPVFGMLLHSSLGLLSFLIIFDIGCALEFNFLSKIQNKLPVRLKKKKPKFRGKNKSTKFRYLAPIILNVFFATYCWNDLYFDEATVYDSSGLEDLFTDIYDDIAGGVEYVEFFENELERIMNETRIPADPQMILARHMTGFSDRTAIDKAYANLLESARKPESFTAHITDQECEDVIISLSNIYREVGIALGDAAEIMKGIDKKFEYSEAVRAYDKITFHGNETLEKFMKELEAVIKILKHIVKDLAVPRDKVHAFQRNIYKLLSMTLILPTIGFCAIILVTSLVLLFFAPTVGIPSNISKYFDLIPLIYGLIVSVVVIGTVVNYSTARSVGALCNSMLDENYGFLNEITIGFPDLGVENERFVFPGWTGKYPYASSKLGDLLKRCDRAGSFFTLLGSNHYFDIDKLIGTLKNVDKNKTAVRHELGNDLKLPPEINIDVHDFSLKDGLFELSYSTCKKYDAGLDIERKIYEEIDRAFYNFNVEAKRVISEFQAICVNALQNAGEFRKLHEMVIQEKIDSCFKGIQYLMEGFKSSELRCQSLSDYKKMFSNHICTTTQFLVNGSYTNVLILDACLILHLLLVGWFFVERKMNFGEETNLSPGRYMFPKRYFKLFNDVDDAHFSDENKKMEMLKNNMKFE